jgi:hypothetical protein
MVLAFSGRILAAEELPSSEGEESFDIEPPLLIPYERPEHGAAKDGPAMVRPALDLEKLARDVERAKRSALNAEHLFRMGVLAKVEAEQRALRVVRLQADLENARLARMKEDVSKAEVVAEAKTPATNNGATSAAKPGDAELAKAIEAAHGAAKKREEAEIAAAETNLARQQKLLSLGSGRKSDVARAARKLEELKASRN